MTATQINSKIASGLQITICPWDSVWTNQASATVLEVSEGRVVHYRVEDCESTVTRQVSFSTWNTILAQAY